MLLERSCEGFVVFQRRPASDQMTTRIVIVIGVALTKFESDGRQSPSTSSNRKQFVVQGDVMLC